MRAALIALMRRELALSWAGGGGPLLAVGLYAALIVLAPLSGATGVGAVWPALALSGLLSLERLFERDFEDGGLDLLALGPLPLEATCLVKVLAQWLAVGLPLAAAAAVAALAQGAAPAAAPLTALCAALAGLAFAFVGGVGAALALGSRRGGLLIAVIVLPLLAPAVIFGAGTLEAFVQGLAWRPPLALLAAYALAALALCPWAMAAACRNAQS